MTETKRAVVEFVVLAVILVVLIVGVVALAFSDTEAAKDTATALLDIAKLIIGALIALAYAARGIMRGPRNGSK